MTEATSTGSKRKIGEGIVTASELFPDIEKEPVCLLDVTGSMSYPNSENGPSRQDVIKEAFGSIVNSLAAQDSAWVEEAEAGEDKGGLLTTIFSSSLPGGAQALEDINPDNLQEKFGQIRWGGGTRIVPGWHLLVQQYMEEFGKEAPADRPLMLALVITDGEAEDADEFARILKQATGGVYVVVALLGYGAEHEHTKKSWGQIAHENGHVRVVDFGNTTDPQVISDTLLHMLS